MGQKNSDRGSHRGSQSPARRRILETATALFYAKGVHAIGIDRIIAEAAVAKATFYHHFPAKDDLVRSYLTEEYARQKAAVESLTAAAKTPDKALFGVFDFMGKNGSSPGFRGCPFVNVAAEYPDPKDPVRLVVSEYRRWVRGLFRDLLDQAGHPHPERTAGILMLIRDGIVVGSDLDDAKALRRTIGDTVARILALE